MQLQKKGKTKDVYKLSNGNYLLQFKDSVTGGPGGTVDPGGNQVVGQQSGMGKACLAMSAYIFKYVKQLELAETHMLNVDLDAGNMEVKPASILGEGLEVIVRFVAAGSFVKRYGLYVQEGHRFSNPLIEITLKDDQRDDPLINDECILELGLLGLEELARVKAMARKISFLVKDLAESANLELYDMKMEFGRNSEGKLMLIDEISPGSMRAFRDGVPVKGIELAKTFVRSA